MKVGIIGAGTISEKHLEAYRALGVPVVAIADRSEERARARADAYGVKKVYTETAALLADPEIDAVSICTPVFTHSPIAIDAMRAGKHVLCEKPPAMDADEIAAAIAERDRTEKVLCYAFCCRFEPGTLRFREMAKAGAFGALCHAEAGRVDRCINPGGWFNDKKFTKGGTLFDAAIHEIDQLFFILGYPEIASVTAVMGAENARLHEELSLTGKAYASATTGSFENNVETRSDVLVRMKNGAAVLLRSSSALLTLNTGAYFDLSGTKGGARWDNRGGGFRTLLLEGGEMKESSLGLTARDEDLYLGEIKHFLDLCEGREKENLLSAEDAHSLMKLYDAIYRSAEEGREVLL